MQGLDPEVQEPQHDPSYEGMVEEQTSETGSVAPGSGQHVEEPGHNLHGRPCILHKSPFY
jgi:hypothetical protein